MNKTNRLLAVALTLTQSLAFAEPYSFIDAWSTSPQRDVWRATLGAMSLGPAQANFHLAGHIHSMTGKFPVSPGNGSGVLAFLQNLQDMLGLSAAEGLVLAEQHRSTTLSANATGLITEVPMLEMRFAVTFEGYREVRRAIVVHFSEATGAVLGLFNGHLPTVGSYETVGSPKTLAQVSQIAKASEGEQISVLESTLGWFMPSYLSGQALGNRQLVWILRVRASSGSERDYIIVATTGVITYRGDTKFNFVSQEHRGYSRSGVVHWTTDAAAPKCTAISSTCTDPAFGDSVLSQQNFPRVTDHLEYLTTAGSSGVSGFWRAPPSWELTPSLNPWRNNSGATSTNLIAILADGVAGSFCNSGPNAVQPPCGQGIVLAFSPGDRDVSVFGHEYSHRLLSAKKILRSQSGVDGQTTEAMCDVVGVGVENGALARAQPCADSCPYPRTDFVLSVLANSWRPTGFSVDMRSVANLSCGSPRTWIGSAFYRAVRRYATDLIGSSCCPTCICGLPTDPATTAVKELDVTNELLLRTALEAFAIAPDMFPTQTDFLNAVLSKSVPGGFRSFFPVDYLKDELSRTQGAPCP
jgi:hypothetical protein